jgi:uncharacterized protein YdeI (YjbR/CyaY-like superfamily)
VVIPCDLRMKVNRENIIQCKTRQEWRNWLAENFDSKEEAWLVFHKKNSGKTSISYNDAVEEALCFGWIDSIVKRLDDISRIQRFSPRRAKSNYSQPNIERVKWLLHNKLVHPGIEKELQQIAEKPFIFPADIIGAIRKDSLAWKNYQSFSGGYKRIRVAYIDSARDRPEEFRKRLDNFVAKTMENKRIGGVGGIDKYYQEVIPNNDEHEQEKTQRGQTQPLAEENGGWQKGIQRRTVRGKR